MFWTDCELIPELTSSQCTNRKRNQKGKGTDETLHGMKLSNVEKFCIHIGTFQNQHDKVYTVFQ